jgi:Protein of unknown function (DUF3309)
MRTSIFFPRYSVRLIARKNVLAYCQLVENAAQLRGGKIMMLILTIVLVLALLGSLPTWPYSRGWGYYPSGGLSLVLVILLILFLLGRL